MAYRENPPFSGVVQNAKPMLVSISGVTRRYTLWASSKGRVAMLFFLRHKTSEENELIALLKEVRELQTLSDIEIVGRGTITSDAKKIRSSAKFKDNLRKAAELVK